jgi:hypothetical protein
MDVSLNILLIDLESILVSEIIQPIE